MPEAEPTGLDRWVKPEYQGKPEVVGSALVDALHVAFDWAHTDPEKQQQARADVRDLCAHLGSLLDSTRP